MAKGISFGSTFVGKTSGAEELTPERLAADESSDSPLKILIIGNFRGSARGNENFGDLPKPVMIDRDNFDDVLARFKPSVRLGGVHPDGSAVEIEFSELDDFHPDRLYRELPLFDALRDTRDRLENPKTFAAAATDVRGWAEAQAIEKSRGPAERTGPAEETSSPRPTISGENLLDQLLEQSESSSKQDSTESRSSVFDLLLEKVAGPYRIAADDPDKQPLLDLVDALAADRMRAILHHPQFQAIEAAWRSLDFLVRRIETDVSLKLFVADFPKAALAGDLEAVASLKASQFYKLLADLPAGSPPWTMVVGNYSFNSARADVEMLGRIAQIAAAAQAPFVAAAEPAVFGCPEPAEQPDPDDWDDPEPAALQMWQQLRGLSAANSLGLVAPRFLLRQTYGPDTSTTEELDFVELPTADHGGFLWGNGAFVAACLVAQAFSRNGWNLSDDLGHDIDDLPVHLYDADGEAVVKPCAEALLGDRAVERILKFGIMPLQSFAGRGTVRLARLQSLADPPAALAGRWE